MAPLLPPPPNRATNTRRARIPRSDERRNHPMGVCPRRRRRARPEPFVRRREVDVERHGSETYYVIGEGLLGESAGGRQPTMAAASAEAALAPPFRCSRRGPKGIKRQLSEAVRKELAAAMTTGPEAFSQVPSGFT